MLPWTQNTRFSRVAQRSPISPPISCSAQHQSPSRRGCRRFALGYPLATVVLHVPNRRVVLLLRFGKGGLVQDRVIQQLVQHVFRFLHGHVVFGVDGDELVPAVSGKTNPFDADGVGHTAQAFQKHIEIALRQDIVHARMHQGDFPSGLEQLAHVMGARLKVGDFVRLGE